MKFLSKSKDGGPYSTVTAYWLIECKSLFSIALLHFAHGTREEFHDHAFDAISWILKGKLREKMLDGEVINHKPGLKPVFTWKDTFHKVCSYGDSWALTFRGPWIDKWHEYNDSRRERTTLTHGRKIVETLS